MRAVIVYESMYGNTHEIAQAIAEGMAGGCDVAVTAVADADPAAIAGADLLVVGGPTHVHGMSRESTRKAAVTDAAAGGVELDADAPGPGLREWLIALPANDSPAAAFDTRIKAPAVLTGRASRRMAHLLRRHGHRMVTAPQSFFVTKDNHLLDGEQDRAREWGRALAGQLAASA
jgi:menaquinone-dependent protoporphyrinogen IX oxidase